MKTTPKNLTFLSPTTFEINNSSWWTKKILLKEIQLQKQNILKYWMVQKLPLKSGHSLKQCETQQGHSMP